jgi:hypothetical protein
MDAGLSCEPTDISQWEIGIGHSVELSIGESSHSKCAESESLANPNPSFEHVGVNDECLYIDIGPTPPIPTSQSLDDEVEEEEVEEDDFWDDEIEKDDIVTDRDPPRKPDVDYDKNDSPMAVGTIYSDMNAFTLALATHATKYEFQYNIEKCDKSRYRVYCSGKDVGCRWRMLTSTLGDKCTVKVIFLHSICIDVFF